MGLPRNAGIYQKILRIETASNGNKNDIAIFVYLSYIHYNLYIDGNWLI